jgi:hypothetical protein
MKVIFGPDMAVLAKAASDEQVQERNQEIGHVLKRRRGIDIP